MAQQIKAMGAHLSRSAAEVRQRLARAQARYDQETPDLGPLRAKLEASRGQVTWMPAEVEEDWEGKHPLPQLPPDFAVLASDGSQIDLERHAPASCYLINIGQVMLRYGSQPDAYLSGRASLFYREEDLFLTDPANANQREPVESKLLRLRRSVMEVEALAELAAQPGAGAIPPLPSLALLDGTLILWELGAKEVKPFVRDQLLRPFLEALESLRQRAHLALASYISHPRATEVVDALRIAQCPYTPPNCDRHCRRLSPPEGRPCDQVAEGVRDADLFRERLGPGERSPLFLSRSRVLDYYEGHKVYFFYVDAGEEIARVEVPAWVALDPQRRDLAHALVLDQSHRGQGYPVALMEAHEQAVVRASDRQAFWALVEEALTEGRLPALASPKAHSKRIRGI